MKCKKALKAQHHLENYILQRCLDKEAWRQLSKSNDKLFTKIKDEINDPLNLLADQLELSLYDTINEIYKSH